MKQLLHSGVAQRLGIAGRQRVATHFAFDAFAKRLHEHVRQVRRQRCRLTLFEPGLVLLVLLLLFVLWAAKAVCQ